MNYIRISFLLYSLAFFQSYVNMYIYMYVYLFNLKLGCFLIISQNFFFFLFNFHLRYCLHSVPSLTHFSIEERKFHLFIRFLFGFSLQLFVFDSITITSRPQLCLNFNNRIVSSHFFLLSVIYFLHFSLEI